MRVSEQQQQQQQPTSKWNQSVDPLFSSAVRKIKRWSFISLAIDRLIISAAAMTTYKNKENEKIK